MNLRKKPLICKGFAAILLTQILWQLPGCGVKGDPLPPETPPEIGRGRPTYKRATEDLQIKSSKDLEAHPSSGDSNDDDSD